MLLDKIKESKGYVSIEVCIIAGIFIAFGAVSIFRYQGNSGEASTKVLNSMNSTINSYNPYLE